MRHVINNISSCISRVLTDFGRLMEVFRKHKVLFDSVTRAFNTARSMGRPTLYIKWSCGQIEREIIPERKRHKIVDTRKIGKWTGGVPILGHDIDSRGSKLVVNELEAIRVRQNFELYLQLQALSPVVRDLDGREWNTNTWVTKSDKLKGGQLLWETRFTSF